MNIYAADGFKVIVTEESVLNGTSQDREKVEEYLKIGEVYTVAGTSVSKNHTKVRLREFPGVFFNTVNFEDVESQSAEKDRRHLDWERHNRK